MKSRIILLSALLVIGCGETNKQAPVHVGKKVYEQYCRSCHHAGLAGSPEYRNPSDWEERVNKGRETLLTNVVTGITPGMPPKGLCMSCSERELLDAIDYMLPDSKTE